MFEDDVTQICDEESVIFILKRNNYSTFLPVVRTTCTRTIQAIPLYILNTIIFQQTFMGNFALTKNSKINIDQAKYSANCTET